MLFGAFLKSSSLEAVDPESVSSFGECIAAASEYVYAFRVDDVKSGAAKAILSSSLDDEVFVLLDVPEDEVGDGERVRMSRRRRLERVKEVTGEDYSIKDVWDISCEDEDLMEHNIYMSDNIEVRQILDLAMAPGIAIGNVNKYGFMPLAADDLPEGAMDMIRGDIYYIAKQLIPSGDICTYLDGYESLPEEESDRRFEFVGQAFKRAALIVAAPAVIKAALDNAPFNARWLLSAATKASSIISCINDMEKWEQEGCDDDEYKDILLRTEQYITDNEDVLEYLYVHGDPNRNDPCPCGSGKKFKACHGRYVGKAGLLVSLSTPSVAGRIEHTEYKRAITDSLAPMSKLSVPERFDPANMKGGIKL